MGMAAKKLPPVASEADDVEETVQFNFRIPKRLLAALDDWLADMNHGRRLGKVTRAEVLRAVLERDVVARPPLEQEDEMERDVQITLCDANGHVVSRSEEDVDILERVQWFAVDKNGKRAFYRGKLVRKQYLVERAPEDVQAAQKMADRDIRERNLNRVHAAAVLLSTPSGKKFFDEWCRSRRPTKLREQDISLPSDAVARLDLPWSRLMPPDRPPVRHQDASVELPFVMDEDPLERSGPSAARFTRGK